MIRSAAIAPQFGCARLQPQREHDRDADRPEQRRRRGRLTLSRQQPDQPDRGRTAPRSGDVDAFVTKLSPDGRRLRYSTDRLGYTLTKVAKS